MREAGPGRRTNLSPGDFSCGDSGSQAVAATADTDTNEGGDAGGRLVREAGPGLRTPGDFSCGGAEGDEQREAGPGPGQIHSPGHCSCGEGGGAEGDEQLDVGPGPGPGQLHTPGDFSCGGGAGPGGEGGAAGGEITTSLMLLVFSRSLYKLMMSFLTASIEEVTGREGMSDLENPWNSGSSSSSLDEGSSSSLEEVTEYKLSTKLFKRAESISGRRTTMSPQHGGGWSTRHLDQETPDDTSKGKCVRTTLPSLATNLTSKSTLFNSLIMSFTCIIH